MVEGNKSPLLRNKPIPGSCCRLSDTLIAAKIKKKREREKVSRCEFEWKKVGLKLF